LYSFFSAKSGDVDGARVVLSLGCRALVNSVTPAAAAVAATAAVISANGGIGSGNISGDDSSAPLTSALAALYVRNGASGVFEYRARTEVLVDTSTPSFCTRFSLNLLAELYGGENNNNNNNGNNNGNSNGGGVDALTVAGFRRDRAAGCLPELQLRVCVFVADADAMERLTLPPPSLLVGEAYVSLNDVLRTPNREVSFALTHTQDGRAAAALAAAGSAVWLLAEDAPTTTTATKGNGGSGGGGGGAGGGGGGGGGRLGNGVDGNSSSSPSPHIDALFTTGRANAGFGFDDVAAVSGRQRLELTIGCRRLRHR
jgi:hypothetical protein